MTGGSPYAAWRARVEAELRGASFEGALVSRGPGDIPLEPLYVEAHLEGSLRRLDATGSPGSVPYVRGTTPVPVTRVVQRYRPASLEGLREPIREDVTGGMEGAWLRLDGAALDAGELASCLEPLGGRPATVLVDPGARVVATAAVTADALARAGLTARSTPGASTELHFGADPLGVLARQGWLPASLAASYDEMGVVARELPDAIDRARTVWVSTEPHHAAGAHAVLELGYAAATLVEYLRELVGRGLTVEGAASRVSLVFAVGTDVFVEVAKLRAARLLWTKVLVGAGAPSVPAPRLLTVTSERTLTVRDPYNNLLRATAQAFAAMVGGADVCSVTPFDAALGESDAFARRIARNAALVLKEEAHVGEVADAAGGAYFVEWLTDRMARDAWAVLGRVERAGGMGAYVSSGALAAELDDAAASAARAIAKRERVIVGVSEYAATDEARLIRPAVRPPEADSLAAGEEEAGATAPALAVRREAEPFERLRERAEGELGLPPRVYLARLGAPSEHKPREAFVRGFFAAGGLAVVDGPAYVRAEAPIACICGTDERYAHEAAELARALKSAGALRVVLAGKPKQLLAELTESGVDVLIHLGVDVVRTLDGLLSSLERPRGGDA